MKHKFWDGWLKGIYHLWTGSLKTTYRMILLIFVVSMLGSRLHGVDSNGNGLSDVWEAKYPDATNPDAQAKSKDGFTNLAKYLLGGNPNINGDLLHFWSATINEGGYPVLTWTVPNGLSIQVETSPDLNAWTVASPVFVTTGQPQSFTIPLIYTQQSRYFWRLRARQPSDSDEDGLNDWEEFSLGSNPNKYSSYDDGMSDGYKWQNGMDVTQNDANGDADHDGVLNYMDARPNDLSVGIFTVTITAPGNGTAY